MSGHESFIDIMTDIHIELDKDHGSHRLTNFDYEAFKDKLRRLELAHSLDMLNPSHAYMAREREEYLTKAERMREYDRGYRDGKKVGELRKTQRMLGMPDAKARADTALRLRNVTFGEGSHENLSRIAYAIIHPCTTGWTRDSCEALRDRLLRLIEGGEDGLAGRDGMVGDVGGDCVGVYDAHKAHVTYDELGNERHKAVCKLRKIHTDAGGFVKALASAIGVEWQAPRVTQTLAEVRDRLIHLLGGDQPTLSDLYGIWTDQTSLPKAADFAKLDTESDIQLTENAEDHQIGQGNGTCPNDVPFASITDELRGWIDEYGPSDGETFFVGKFGTIGSRRLSAIADRIDERHTRAVQDATQEVHDSMEVECDRLQAKLDESDAAIQHCRESWELKYADLVAHTHCVEAKLADYVGQYDPTDAKVMELQEGVGILRRAAERDADVLESLNLSLEEMTAERYELKAFAERVEDAVKKKDDVTLFGVDYVPDSKTGDAQPRLDELTHDVEMWRDRAEDMRMERDDLQAKLDELDASGATELYRLLKSTLGEAKCIADRIDAHNGELRETEAKLDLMRQQRDLYHDDCQMYLELLRDAARERREVHESYLCAKEELDSWASKLDVILHGGDRDQARKEAANDQD